MQRYYRHCCPYCSYYCSHCWRYHCHFSVRNSSCLTPPHLTAWKPCKRVRLPTFSQVNCCIAQCEVRRGSEERATFGPDVSGLPDRGRCSLAGVLNVLRALRAFGLAKLSFWSSTGPPAVFPLIGACCALAGLVFLVFRQVPRPRRDKSGPPTFIAFYGALSSEKRDISWTDGRGEFPRKKLILAHPWS